MAGEQLAASKAQAWFCTTGLPSDVVIEVDAMTFHLHKAPLMSKSRKLHQLITEQEQQQQQENEFRISLSGFPGGCQAFEAAAKFCYGVGIELTASTVVPLRCAAEYLDMTDDLISGAESFFTQSILSSLSHSISALKSCEDLSPLAEEIGIPSRCIESIAARARAPGSWIEDLTVLGLPLYERVISAMRGSDLRPEVLEGALLCYAKRSIPGLSRSRSSRSLRRTALNPAEQREVLEAVVSNLPLSRVSDGGGSCKFLFRLLRAANILRTCEGSRSALEARIAARLECAAVEDLLMPSYSEEAETLYDVGAAERIVRGFVRGLEEEGARAAQVAAVAKLVDGYLAEVASDPSLTPARFCGLAGAVPDEARVYADGIYRAVDVYLKAHGGLTEEEKETVCGVMDCRKLTTEACTHAARNEWLPLRTVLQVLFFKQLQLRRAMTMNGPPIPEVFSEERELGNEVLKLDMDSVRDRVQDLEGECSTMRKRMERVMDYTPAGRGSSLMRRFGCKFINRTQVCDSQGPTATTMTVVGPRSRARASSL